MMSAKALIARHLGADEPILAEAGDDKDRVVVTPIRVLVARSGRFLGQRSQSLLLDAVATIDIQEKDGAVEVVTVGALGAALGAMGGSHHLILSEMGELSAIKDAIVAALLERRQRSLAGPG